MVAIRRKLLHSINSLILLLISLLGFTTSCEVEAEYGTPHADFIINGKVESATDNKSIPDIIVEMRRVPLKGSTFQSYLVGTSFSYENRNYYISATEAPEEQAFQITFTDTDGTLNGEYETLDTIVIFKDPKFTHGDGSWYKGYTEKELDVQLKPKE
jgi:putative lipoprotein (rSAM/lipoprotein system)